LKPLESVAATLNHQESDIVPVYPMANGVSRHLVGTDYKVGGFDFEFKTFLTDDEGRQYQSPQFYRANLTEIARLHRALSCKQQGSHNREKARHRLLRPTVA
jgi:hypothetical protein